MHFLNLFPIFKHSTPTVERWANHNSKKASADDLIAGAIVASFAEHFKHWKFIGKFDQKWSTKSNFQSTSLSRKMVGKKHVLIDFIFKQIHTEAVFNYKVIGCEVNGIRISDRAFQHIYKSWLTVFAQIEAAEEVAEKAKNEMESNELRWDLAESLLGMKRNGLGVLVPVKTSEEYSSYKEEA